jgi:RNA recognition motif-containing protein
MVGKNLVRSVVLAYGKKSKRSLGYGFLDYNTLDAASKAVKAFDGLMYNNRPLNSNLKDESEISSKKKKTRIEKNTIFLSNLDLSLTEEELINMCNDILGEGLVVSIEIPVDKVTGNPRGFAFIEFVNEETVSKAIIELNNLEVLEKLLSCTEMKRPSVFQIR